MGFANRQNRLIRKPRRRDRAARRASPEPVIGLGGTGYPLYFQDEAGFAVGLAPPTLHRFFWGTYTEQGGRLLSLSQLRQDGTGNVANFNPGMGPLISELCPTCLGVYGEITTAPPQYSDGDTMSCRACDERANGIRQ